MKKWEYKCIRREYSDFDDFEDEYFNFLGAAGWELVSVNVIDNPTTFFYFKRPLP